MSYSCEMCGRRFKDNYDKHFITISGRERGKGGDYLYGVDTLLPQELADFDVCEDCCRKIQDFVRRGGTEEHS